VGTVVGMELGLVVGVILVVSKRWLEWQ
jgi:hypothetical protein